MRVRLILTLSLGLISFLQVHKSAASDLQAIADEHNFSCYKTLTQLSPPEYSDLVANDYGVATHEMKFSKEFDVTGQPVTLYNFPTGTKLYEATPKVRFENHTGRNLTALWKSLSRGDIERGFPAFAYSQVTYFWSGDAIINKIINEKKVYGFDMSEFEFYVSYDVKLPAWNWKKVPSGKRLKKWKSFSCDLAEHEKTHINPTRHFIVEFASEIPSLSAESVNDLRYQLNLLWQNTQKKIGDENIRIDTVTQHGAKPLKD